MENVVLCGVWQSDLEIQQYLIVMCIIIYIDDDG